MLLHTFAPSRQSVRTNNTYMGNIVDSTYTGVYHDDISIHFYPAKEF